jgi:hypothetical protein
MPSRPSVRLPTVSAVAVVAALALLLTGCVPGSNPTPSRSASQPSTPTDAPTATVTPSPTPTAGTAAVPVSVACNTLVSLQTMYDFNPNFTLQSDFSPASGTPANTAAADRGTACAWVNNTSGETVVIAVARPGSLELASIRSAASGGTSVSGYGDAAYYSGTRFDVFRGNYWFVASSNYFASANDASALMKSALAAVG